MLEYFCTVSHVSLLCIQIDLTRWIKSQKIYEILAGNLLMIVRVSHDSKGVNVRQMIM